PGRMPFWRGDRPGRPIEVGAALGAFTRELAQRDESDALTWLGRGYRLEPAAARHLKRYVDEQATDPLFAHARTHTLTRVRDVPGEWRVWILSPFGAKVHAPWALALETRFAQATGAPVQTLSTDDGIVLRFADGNGVRPVFAAADLRLDPGETEELVLHNLE